MIKIKRAHIVSLFKFIAVGLMCGALTGLLIIVILDGPAAFFSDESTWLGPAKEWTRMFAVAFMKLGAILGAIIGLIVGVVVNIYRSTRRVYSFSVRGTASFSR